MRTQWTSEAGQMRRKLVRQPPFMVRRPGGWRRLSACSSLWAGLAGSMGRRNPPNCPNVDRPVITVTTAFKPAPRLKRSKRETDRCRRRARWRGFRRRPRTVDQTFDARRSRVTVYINISDKQPISNVCCLPNVRDALGRVTHKMPDGADDRAIIKADANSDRW